jgi:hypothetical protein
MRTGVFWFRSVRNTYGPERTAVKVELLKKRWQTIQLEYSLSAAPAGEARRRYTLKRELQPI